MKTRVGPAIYEGTTYAMQLGDSRALQNPAVRALRDRGIFRQVATVEIVVPADTPPPPPPTVDVRVMKFVNGQRVATEGMVTRGTKLLFGFRTDRTLEVVSAEVDGEQLKVVLDDYAGTTARSALAMTKVGRDPETSDGLWEATRTGRHVLKVVAQPTTGDPTRREEFETTFLVVEGTEGNTTPSVERPGVIRSVPRCGAGGCRFRELRYQDLFPSFFP